ncbi:hypothetical protein [Paraburkholderia caribensis]|uniref:hypothetical protein n=1 Tax=Paraburkholderia caribensis TaxID=75105 RepID=UPI000AFADFC5|nr:hypothetical protein [Paraburkholderia caribensis]
MTKLSGQFPIERVHQSCTLVTPDCDRSDPDERIAFGFHNLSRNYDALGHCVTFLGYDNVVKEITNIGVGPRGRAEDATDRSGRTSGSSARLHSTACSHGLVSQLVTIAVRH